MRSYNKRSSLAVGRAPPADPYIGPAILEGKAAGVFFHEIFGHRVEGHRQKNEEEGQTFAKKIGEPIMPDFTGLLSEEQIAQLIAYIKSIGGQQQGAAAQSEGRK